MAAAAAAAATATPQPKSIAFIFFFFFVAFIGAFKIFILASRESEREKLHLHFSSLFILLSVGRLWCDVSSWVRVHTSTHIRIQRTYESEFHWQWHRVACTHAQHSQQKREDQYLCSASSNADRWTQATQNYIFGAENLRSSDTPYSMFVFRLSPIIIKYVARRTAMTSTRDGNEWECARSFCLSKEIPIHTRATDWYFHSK